MVPRARWPAPPLNRYVELLWYVDDPPAGYARERALPTGAVELVVNLGVEPMRVFTGDRDILGLTFPHSVVCGAHSRYFVLDTTVRARVVGVHFRAGGATPFLGIPGGELTNLHVALGEVWGRQARVLRERLLDAPDVETVFDRLEQFLLARLAQPPELHPAVALALHESGRDPSLARVDVLRRESGYCAKRFIELFRDAVGLTPKSYCRVRRFQAVIDSLARGVRPGWAAVAADSGYADQSHLNREFRDFAGVTPGSYRPVSPERPNHLAVEP